MNTNIDFTKFYAVRRFETKSGPQGESIDIAYQRGNAAIGYSNMATRGRLHINIPNLIAGIVRGDYRLVMKSE